jgi:UDP-N-acetylmuramate dehydrogenase
MKKSNNVPLAGLTSLHVGGPADTLIELDQNDDLKAVVLANNQGPLWVLGNGTNCLISDQGLPGTVIMQNGGSCQALTTTTFKATAGLSWDDFVQQTISAGLYGLEFTSGIPGTVGAAVVGNIASYGQKVSDRLVSASLLDPKTGTVSDWPNSKLDFDYRDSALHQLANQSLVVLEATFDLSPTPTGQLEYQSALKVATDLGLAADTLANRRQIILETRHRAGSLRPTNGQGPYTAGSFFMNPVVNQEQVEAIITHDESGLSRQQLLRQNQVHSGQAVRVSAAHVLLAAGFRRGQTWGQVQLHPDHVLKVANLGQASAQDIYQVIQTIVSTVQQKLGISLQPEVRILGKF